MSCKEDQILRKSYSFTKKDGKVVNVKSKCIKDKGLPGKGPALFTVKRGTLGQFGYSSKLSAKERYQALKKAVKKLGSGTIIKKLNAIAILNKRTNPKISEIFRKDLAWIQKNLVKN